MKCMHCRDEQVVWSKDAFGIATCSPCPVCNKDGENVRQEQHELNKKLRKEWSEQYGKKPNSA